MNYLENYENIVSQWLRRIIVDPDTVPFDVYGPDGMCVASYENTNKLEKRIWRDFCTLNVYTNGTPMTIDERTNNLHIHRGDSQYVVEPSAWWLDDDTNFEKITTGRLNNRLIRNPDDELEPILSRWQQDPKLALKNRTARVNQICRNQPDYWVNPFPTPLQLVRCNSIPWLSAIDKRAWGIRYDPTEDPYYETEVSYNDQIDSGMLWLPQGKFDQGGWWRQLPNRCNYEVWAKLDRNNKNYVTAVIANDDREGRFLDPTCVAARLSGDMLGCAENLRFDYLAAISSYCSAKEFCWLFLKPLGIR